MRVTAGRDDGAAVGTMTPGSGSRHRGPRDGAAMGTIMFVKNLMQPSLWFIKTLRERTVVVAGRGAELQKRPVFDTSFFEILLFFVMVFGDKLDFHRFRLFLVC